MSGCWWKNFNPHEREARDGAYVGPFVRGGKILIHTSVKLVTPLTQTLIEDFGILIHTSVKLVTGSKFHFHSVAEILIHTSVKLVTLSKAKKL